MDKFGHNLYKKFSLCPSIKIVNMYKTVKQYIDIEYQIDYIIDSSLSIYVIKYNETNCKIDTNKLKIDIDNIIQRLSLNSTKYNDIFCIYIGNISSIINILTVNRTFHTINIKNNMDIIINDIYNYVIQNSKKELKLNLDIIKTDFNIDIAINDINVFNIITDKSKNDINNRKRELIIYFILQNKIYDKWYEMSNEWRELKLKLNNFINLIINKPFDKINIEYKGGRQYNYDFDLSYFINDVAHNIKLEFKNNCKSLNNYPQFLSMSANNFVKNITYGEYFYDNYINKLASMYNITPPNKDEYLKYIYGSNYDKLSFFSYLKKNENNFKNEKKELVIESIKKYINIVDIDINELNKKFETHQCDKIYMLYCDKVFHKDFINKDELFVIGINTIKNGNTLVFNTKKDTTKIHMLLRWKNHLGILYPAWQISIRR
jgi:hypothetical protein